MSDKEQDEVVGRSVKEYGQVRLRLAAHLAEAERLGSVLTSIGISLTTSGDGALKHGHRPDKLGAMPTKESVLELVEEVIQLHLRKAQLSAQLKDLGVPMQP